MKQPAHRALQPFGQIPTYEEGGLALFESGAIVLHIAEKHAGLLPGDANARARAITWMFAAVSTVEPPIVECEAAEYTERDKDWYREHLAMLEDRLRGRLGELSTRLGDADWLDGAFSAGDLMMVMVLRRLNGSAILGEFPGLSAYVARGERAPAFKRAYEAQKAVAIAAAAKAGMSAGLASPPPPRFAWSPPPLRREELGANSLLSQGSSPSACPWRARRSACPGSGVRA